MSWGRKVIRAAHPPHAPRATIAMIEDVATGDVVRTIKMPRQPSEPANPIEARAKRRWDRFVDSVESGFFLARPSHMRYELMEDPP